MKRINADSAQTAAEARAERRQRRKRKRQPVSGGNVRKLQKLIKEKARNP